MFFIHKPSHRSQASQYPVRSAHAQSTHAQSTHKQSTHKQGARTLLGLSTLLALILVFFSLPHNVSAATMGAGFHGNPIPGLQLPHLGNWVTQDGYRAYCIEPGRNNPTANQHAPNLVSTFPAYTANSLGIALTIPALNGTKLAQINYLVDRWGDTTNNSQAAAVQMAIWILRSTPEKYLKEFYSVSAFSGTPSYQTTRDRAQGYVDAAQNTVIAALSGSPQLAITVGTVAPSANSPITGTLTFSGTGWSGDITVSGGSFENGATAVSVRNSHTASIRVLRDSGINSTIEANFSASGTVTGYPGQGFLHASTTANQQRLFTAAPKQQRTISASISPTRTLFAPKVSTAVTNKHVTAGDVLQDSVKFSTDTSFSQGAPPFSSSWLVDDNGKFLPITARATLYFIPQLIGAPSAAVPSSAQVFYSTKFSAHTSHPVNNTVHISADKPADQAGLYSWVIEIVAADQPDWVQKYLPNKYHFRHDFGIPAETHELAMELSIDTQVDRTVAGFGYPLVDNVMVDLELGPWIKDTAGTPLAVSMTGYVYFTDILPVPGPTPSVEAELIDTLSLIVTEPGEYRSPDLYAPDRAGFITYQWCIDDDQSYVNAGTCDDWGLPHETVEIQETRFHTQATSAAFPGEEINDKLFITGPEPFDQLWVSFHAYLESGEQQCHPESLLIATEKQSLSEAIDAQRDAHQLTSHELSDDAPVFTIQSPNILIPERTANTEVLWVEVITDRDENIIHQGECGDPKERTQILVKNYPVPEPPKENPPVEKPVQDPPAKEPPAKEPPLIKQPDEKTPVVTQFRVAELADTAVDYPLIPLAAGGTGLILMGIAILGFVRLRFE